MYKNEQLGQKRVIPIEDCSPGESFKNPTLGHMLKQRWLVSMQLCSFFFVLICQSEYFNQHKGGVLLFLRSASSATAPASLVASVMWDGANVSGHVASHTRTRPPFHGTIVAPSGRLPSSREMPIGSRCAGIFTGGWKI